MCDVVLFSTDPVPGLGEASDEGGGISADDGACPRFRRQSRTKATVVLEVKILVGHKLRKYLHT